MRMHKPMPSRHRGVALVYATVVFLVLVALVSYGVESGRIHMAKTQLQVSADASLRAAMKKFMLGEEAPYSGGKTLRQDAQDIALLNTCDGDPVQLVDAEIQFIKWNNSTRTWTGPYTGAAIRSNFANAIRIIPSRDSSKGNPLPLYFGQIIGRNSCDVSGGSKTTQAGRTVEAIAYVDPAAQFSGFIGLDFLTVKNNLNVSSRNFNNNMNGKNGIIGSNGAISGKNNNDFGGVVLGPTGSMSFSNNNTISGAMVRQTQNLSYPPSPAAPSASTAPPSVTTNLPAGTYCWTSWPSKAVTFAGAATVYVTGNSMDVGNITAFQSKPANLTIYLVGAVTFEGKNNVVIYGQVYGPQATVDFKNGVTIYGSCIAKSIESKNNADLIYDDSLGGGASATPYIVVK